MSNNPHLSAFEKSASNFIEELRNISSEAKILHSSEVNKVNMFIYGIRAIMSKVEKEIEGVEGRFKIDKDD